MSSSTMAYSASVYYGPSSATFPVMGSVSAGESITVQWKEGSWYYIEYLVDSTGKYKRGYVNEYAVNLNGNVVPDLTSTITYNLSLGYYTLQSGGNTYLGPNSGYTVGGSVSAGEQVKIASGISAYGWKFIQYSINGSNQKKRAWVPYYYFTG